MRFAVWLIERPRWFKRTVLIINDLAVLTIALWLAYTLRLSRLYVPPSLDKWMLFVAAPNHRRHRLLYARAVQARDALHRARRHDAHLL